MISFKVIDDGILPRDGVVLGRVSYQQGFLSSFSFLFLTTDEQTNYLYILPKNSKHAKNPNLKKTFPPNSIGYYG